MAVATRGRRLAELMPQERIAGTRLYLLLVGIVAIALACVGPGAWSIDQLLGLDFAGPLWAAFSAVAGGGCRAWACC